MFTNKSNKKVEALVQAILSMIIPVVFIIASVVFLSQTNYLESFTEENDIMYNIIKYALLALDFVAAVIIIRTTYGLLYDLDILKRKQHKARIKED